MELRLDQIKRDDKLSPRAGIDKTTVAVYAASFDQLPPVDVFWIEGRDGWWLVDGWHRLGAGEDLGLAYIEANEHQGTFDDALEFAYDANLKHGKPLTLGERKDAVRLKLRRHTERSNNWIAQDCGITDKTVTSLRDEMESTSEIPKLTELLGRDDKWRPREMPKIEDSEPEPIETVKLYRGDMLEEEARERMLAGIAPDPRQIVDQGKAGVGR